jgi:DNA-directed RNA polymerases I, II, and III subunit RPABC2
MDEDDYDIDNYDIDEPDEYDDEDYIDQENTEEQKFNIISYNDVIKNINNKEKKTIPYLSKFEKARIIGTRLQQLAYGAETKINTENINNINEIVLEELKQRKIPFIIRRVMPNGEYEDWKMEEFEYV